jgi:hypothetical protein
MAVDHAPNTTSLLENLEPAEAALPMASVLGAATAALPTGRGVVVAVLPAECCSATSTRATRATSRD